MSEKQKFQEAWMRESATTLKVLRAFPADQMDFKPHPATRSAQELAWTFVFEGVGGSQATQGEFKFPPPGLPQMPTSWPAMLSEVQKALDLLLERTRNADEAHLNTTVKFATGPGQVSDLRRLDVLWYMLNDQIHHRGQFTVYLRMAGGKVPSIYGPSKDEPWR